MKNLKKVIDYLVRIFFLTFVVFVFIFIFFLVGSIIFLLYIAFFVEESVVLSYTDKIEDISIKILQLIVEDISSFIKNMYTTNEFVYFLFNHIYLVPITAIGLIILIKLDFIKNLTKINSLQTLKRYYSFINFITTINWLIIIIFTQNLIVAIVELFHNDRNLAEFLTENSMLLLIGIVTCIMTIFVQFIRKKNLMNFKLKILLYEKQGLSNEEIFQKFLAETGYNISS